MSQNISPDFLNTNDLRFPVTLETYNYLVIIRNIP